MLLYPTGKYISFIENSKHYLNSPKHMFNHDLDCLYRQGIVFSKEKAIEFVRNHLLHYGHEEPYRTAVKWVEWRETMDTQEFMKLNVNSYIDKTPKHIEDKHKFICDWTENNTTYQYGYPSVPSYPFKNR